MFQENVFPFALLNTSLGHSTNPPTSLDDYLIDFPHYAIIPEATSSPPAQSAPTSDNALVFSLSYDKTTRDPSPIALRYSTQTIRPSI